jgi:hypothetical protein
LYQSAYGIVLALRFAVVGQTGNESNYPHGCVVINAGMVHTTGPFSVIFQGGIYAGIPA